jgi:hypothetical protein
VPPARVEPRLLPRVFPVYVRIISSSNAIRRLIEIALKAKQ